MDKKKKWILIATVLFVPGGTIIGLVWAAHALRDLWRQKKLEKNKSTPPAT